MLAPKYVQAESEKDEKTLMNRTDSIQSQKNLDRIVKLWEQVMECQEKRKLL